MSEKIVLDFKTARAIEVPAPAELVVPALEDGRVEITFRDARYKNPNVSDAEEQAYQKWCNATKNGFLTPEAIAARKFWYQVRTNEGK